MLEFMEQSPLEQPVERSAFIRTRGKQAASDKDNTRLTATCTWCSKRAELRWEGLGSKTSLQLGCTWNQQPGALRKDVFVGKGFPTFPPHMWTWETIVIQVYLKPLYSLKFILVLYSPCSLLFLPPAASSLYCKIVAVCNIFFYFCGIYFKHATF